MKYQILLITVLMVLIDLYCGKPKQRTIYTEKHTIDNVTLRDAVVQTGEVQPVIKVDIKSEASGKIESISIREGQKVKKGDLLMTIDPRRLTFSKKNLDLAVQKARLDVNVAERYYNDAKKLSESGTVSEKQLFDLASKKEAADIALKQQLLQLNDIVYQLSKTRVTSPMDGVVISLDVEEGEIAVSATNSASGGTALATIADTRTLEVISQIGEADYLHLKKGQKVILRPEATKGIFTTGTISFISLSAKKRQSNELGTFEVRVSIDSLISGIVPGINITTEFVIMEKQNVLGIPNHFVNKDKKGFTVLKVEKSEGSDSMFKPVPIKVGVTDYTHYEILDGLKKGDIVMFRDSTGGPKPKGSAK